MSENENTHSVGDELTIRRGKLKGEAGTVALVGKDVTGETVYSIQLPNGILTNQAHSNVKAQPEATIGAGALAAMISEWLKTVPRGAADRLIADLDGALPGFANKVTRSV